MGVGPRFAIIFLGLDLDLVVEEDFTVEIVGLIYGKGGGNNRGREKVRGEN